MTALEETAWSTAALGAGGREDEWQERSSPLISKREEKKKAPSGRLCLLHISCLPLCSIAPSSKTRRKPEADGNSHSFLQGAGLPLCPRCFTTRSNVPATAQHHHAPCPGLGLKGAASAAESQPQPRRGRAAPGSATGHPFAGITQLPPSCPGRTQPCSSVAPEPQR